MKKRLLSLHKKSWYIYIYKKTRCSCLRFPFVCIHIMGSGGRKNVYVSTYVYISRKMYTYQLMYTYVCIHIMGSGGRKNPPLPICMYTYQLYMYTCLHFPFVCIHINFLVDMYTYQLYVYKKVDMYTYTYQLFFVCIHINLYVYKKVDMYTYQLLKVDMYTYRYVYKKVDMYTYQFFCICFEKKLISIPKKIWCIYIYNKTSLFLCTFPYHFLHPSPTYMYIYQLFLYVRLDKNMISVRTKIHMYTYTKRRCFFCTSVWKRAKEDIYIQEYMYIYMYTYIYTYIHIYMYIYMAENAVFPDASAFALCHIARWKRANPLRVHRTCTSLFESSDVEDVRGQM